jgi:conjugative transfer signal peptidase TraF
MRRVGGLLPWGAFVALAVAVPGALRHSALRLNYSDSVPVGLYRSQPESNVPFAGICLNSTTLRSAFDAGLKLEAGECPDGHQPILKTVYRATPESPIVLDSQGFTVAGVPIPNTKPKAFSKAGKPLTHYVFGRYTSGLWAISGYSRDSFDSRYFGPVPGENIRFYAKPLLVF